MHRCRSLSKIAGRSKVTCAYLSEVRTVIFVSSVLSCVVPSGPVQFGSVRFGPVRPSARSSSARASSKFSTSYVLSSHLLCPFVLYSVLLLLRPVTRSPPNHRTSNLHPPPVRLSILSFVRLCCCSSVRSLSSSLSSPTRSCFCIHLPALFSTRLGRTQSFKLGRTKSFKLSMVSSAAPNDVTVECKMAAEGGGVSVGHYTPHEASTFATLTLP